MISKEKKTTIIKKFQQGKSDTGSSEVQVAILTKRIGELTDHLSKNRQDFQSQKGLLIMVGKRKRLLKYLSKKDKESYRRTVDQLSIRG